METEKLPVECQAVDGRQMIVYMMSESGALLHKAGVVKGLETRGVAMIQMHQNMNNRLPENRSLAPMKVMSPMNRRLVPGKISTLDHFVQKVT